MGADCKQTVNNRLLCKYKAARRSGSPSNTLAVVTMESAAGTPTSITIIATAYKE
jgi:hypothetical protein